MSSPVLRAKHTDGDFLETQTYHTDGTFKATTWYDQLCRIQRVYLVYISLLIRSSIDPTFCLQFKT